MSRIDQFESVFRAAAKPVYQHTRRTVNTAILFTDLPAADVAAYAAGAERVLAGMDGAARVRWTRVDQTGAPSVGDVLALVERKEPDLVVAYRNLHSTGWKWPYTLGDHVEVLTQVTTVPVLLLPRPEAGVELETADQVMAMTDHLAGDDRLVQYAAMMTPAGGTLALAHIEDEAVFERYVGLVGKIPDLDTDVARTELKARMLREATDYIDSCRAVLAEGGVPITVEAEVNMGHHLAAYRELVTRRGVDLLVLNTKDDDQLAMHGLAYPLAVELRDLPMLLL